VRFCRCQVLFVLGNLNSPTPVRTQANVDPATCHTVTSFLRSESIHSYHSYQFNLNCPVFAVVGTVITECGYSHASSVSIGTQSRAVILTIRTYALYERSSTLLAFLTAVWFVRSSKCPVRHVQSHVEQAIGGVNIWALIRWTGSLGE
jgi:hypothetical protein